MNNGNNATVNIEYPRIQDNKTIKPEIMVCICTVDNDTTISHAYKIFLILLPKLQVVPHS